MDRATLDEIYDYTGWVWGQVTGAITEIGDDILSKPAPGSGWPALRNCLGHICFGWDIWMSSLDGLPPVEFDASTTDLPALETHYQGVRRRWRTHLDSLTDAELAADRDVQTRTGVLRYTSGEILFHILTHDRGHHGDISTLFYQLGKEEELPMIDYRFYVDTKR